MIYKLENTIQDYAWGSRSLMPEFLGRENPAHKPWAELWMGAHPRSPSRARPAADPDGEGSPLDELIAADPAAFLGEKTAKKFGQLPFLFKLLAAGAPLSIQCHPTLEQARAGFERENRAGIPVDGNQRNYRDANHKPEIILALTPFVALRGLRPAGRIVHFFSGFPVPALTALAAALEKDAGGESLKKFLRTLLSAPAETAAGWIEAIRNQGKSPPAEADLAEFRLFERLADFYPGDSGCLAPFYLNLIRLKPGEALFLGPGEPHAYMEGLGVELMANSDNVLRAGLTPKHIDVEELLAIVNCRAGEPEILLPRAKPRGDFIEEEYPRRADEFTLSVLKSRTAPGTPAAAVLETRGPEILFCGGGSASLLTGPRACGLAKGESVFIPAPEKSYTLTGEGVFYRAGVPT